MNGKPGDHPITDLMVHRIAVFGEPLDTQLRQLGELMSYDRLCDWFQQVADVRHIRHLWRDAPAVILVEAILASLMPARTTVGPPPSAV